MREPQSNRQQAPTYKAGSEAKEEPGNSTSIVEADLGAQRRNRMQSKQLAITMGKENGSKNIDTAQRELNHQFKI